MFTISDLFKSAVSWTKADQVQLAPEGAYVAVGGRFARFVWPEGVAVDIPDMSRMYGIQPDVFRAILEMSAAHDGLGSVAYADKRITFGFKDGHHQTVAVSELGDHVVPIDPDTWDTFTAGMVRSVSVDGGEFTRVARMVGVCVSSERSRPVLACMRFMLHDGVASACSTDRFKASAARVRNAVVVGDGGFSVPFAAVKVFARVPGSVTVGCTTDHSFATPWLATECDGWNVGILCVHCDPGIQDFPAIRGLFAGCYAGSSVCDTTTLISALKTVQPKKDQPVRIRFCAMGVVVGNIDGLSVTVPALHKGSDLLLEVNATYLSKCVSGLKPYGKSVQFLFSEDGLKPFMAKPVQDAANPFSNVNPCADGYLIVPRRFSANQGAWPSLEAVEVGAYAACKPKIVADVTVWDQPVEARVLFEEPAAVEAATEPATEPVEPDQAEHVERGEVEEPATAEPAEPDQAEPADTTTEPVEEPESAEPAEKQSDVDEDTLRLIERFNDVYTALYEETTYTAEQKTATRLFDMGAYPRDVLRKFNIAREDVVASDREAAAFMLACRDLGLLDATAAGELGGSTEAVETQGAEAVEPEAVTTVIPEIPPTATDTATVKAQHHVIARPIVILGGKSVKELSDVFGRYEKRPRKFRDSRGRAVAYVAYDAETAIVAYRECYTPGSDETLESAIGDYLKAHGLTLGA